VNIEIERKFLVNKHNLPLPDSYKSITQAYLMFNDNQVLRVRRTDSQYQLGYKIKKTNIHRLEFEYEIPIEDGEKLISLSPYNIIKKDRYFINIEKHTWEIDLFKDLNKGLVVAEVELSTETEEISIPDWIGQEVSNDDRYLNFNLSKKPYSLW